MCLESSLYCYEVYITHLPFFSLRLISKYHPKKVKEIEEKDAGNIQRRVQAFSYLLETGLLDNLSLTPDNSDQITKIMDSGR